MAKLIAGLVLCVAVGLTPIAAQTDPARATESLFSRALPRVLYVLDYDETDTRAALMARAFEAALRQSVAALWIRVQGELTGDQSVDALRAAAEEQQALAVALFDLAEGETDRFELGATIIAVDDGATIGSVSHEIEADRGGRFMAMLPWRPAMEEINNAVAGLAPLVAISFRGLAGVVVEGIGDAFVLDEQGFGQAMVPRYESFLVRLRLAEHRTEEVQVYVDRTAFEIPAWLYRYPQHSIALMARELSYPSIEYAYYARNGNVLLTATLDSFALGITPMRNVTGTRSNQPQLFTSLPLSQLALTIGRMSGDRDSKLRLLGQIGPFVRIVHGGGLFGLEPVLPAGLTVRIGFERELSQWFILSAALTNDFFWPVRMDFLPKGVNSPFVQRVGPLIAQFGMVRLGVRVVLP